MLFRVLRCTPQSLKKRTDRIRYDVHIFIVAFFRRQSVVPIGSQVIRLVVFFLFSVLTRRGEKTELVASVVFSYETSASSKGHPYPGVFPPVILIFFSRNFSCFRFTCVCVFLFQICEI